MTCSLSTPSAAVSTTPVTIAGISSMGRLMPPAWAAISSRSWASRWYASVPARAPEKGMA